MATPSQILAAICPALSTNPNLETFLELARNKTDSGFFGTDYNEAVALRAAHIYTLSRRTGGESGSVASKTEGRLSVSYASVAAARDLQQTNYGIQLLSLIRTHGPSMSVMGTEEASEAGVLDDSD